MKRYLQSLRLPHAAFAMVASVFGIFASAPASLAQPYGLNGPEPFAAYHGGVFPTRAPGGASSWTVENAFPNLTFVDPIQIVELPGADKFLIAGKSGLLWVIDNDSATTTKTLVLDIEDAVIQQVDGGLLGVVLHPEFADTGSLNRGYMYVFYRYTPEPTHTGVNAYVRLSRFTLAPTLDFIDPASEFVMIQQYDRHDWHNGGGMFFGPDEFLYLSVGDEGGANDQYNSSQKLDDGLFSGVLRIDVDQDLSRSHPILRQPLEPVTPPAGWPPTFSQGYTIPDDNPWVDPTGNTLEEFWAVGLRSPHRMTFDPVEQEIWIGDVGQGSREEVSVALKGSNMQWPYREGNIDGAQPKPDPLIGFDQPPIYDYPRSTGVCVIGGFVYRGTKYPSLYGKYLFGDHTVRNVWTLTPSGGGAPQVDFLVNIPAGGIGGKNGISSFGTDSDDEVYILKLFGTDRDGGIIYKLKAVGAVPDPPQFLSQLNVFSDLGNLVPASGFVPYTVNSPLWSDYAAKGRWVGIPNDGTHDTPAEQVASQAYGDWVFPQGTVFIKHFELPVDEANPALTQRLETRVLVLDEEGGSYGLTYRWNAQQTDAELLIGGESDVFDVMLEQGGLRQQTWDFPSRSDCLTCHNANAGWVRGLSTHQLNGDLEYPSTGVTDNQLRTWNHLGMLPAFRESDLDLLPASVPVDHRTYDLAHRTRSYLDANCSQCHRPNGVNALFDARFHVPLERQGLVDGNLVGIYGVPDPKVIKPQDPGSSILLLRTTSEAADQMPPLARNEVHDAAIGTVAEWIDELTPGGALCDRQPLPVPRNGIAVMFANSQQTGTPASDAFDGDPTTFWQTEQSSPPPFPHGIQVDLGDSYDLVGMTYLPRQDGNTLGTLATYDLFVSDDPDLWGLSLVSGTFEPGVAESRIDFVATARYVRIVANSAAAGGSIGSAAEFSLLVEGCPSGCDSPVDVSALLLDRVGGDTLLNWTSSAATEFDVLHADASDGFAAPACLESRDTDTTAVDTDTASPGTIRFYLVRGVDACLGDTGPAGARSDGQPRAAGLCL